MDAILKLLATPHSRDDADTGCDGLARRHAPVRAGAIQHGGAVVDVTRVIKGYQHIHVEGFVHEDAGEDGQLMGENPLPTYPIGHSRKFRVMGTATDLTFFSVSPSLSCLPHRPSVFAQLHRDRRS